jgi:hypothetical protein
MMKKILIIIVPILLIAGCQPSDPSMSAWPTSPAWDYPIWTIVIVGAILLFSKFPELLNLILIGTGIITIIFFILYFIGFLPDEVNELVRMWWRDY